MMKKSTGAAPSVLHAVGLGTATSSICAVIWAGVIAKLLDGEVIRMESVGYWAMAAHITSVVIGGILAARNGGQGRRQAVILTGVGYYVCLLLVNALFFGGHFTGLGVTLFLIVLAVGVCLMTTGKGSAGARRTQYKIPR